MIHGIVELCQNYPQIPVFLALGVGYFIGKIKIFGFNLGSTAGVLLSALVIGQMNVPVPALLKTVAFALFIFAIGYKVGPEFFGGLKKEGLHYIFISLVVAFTGLVTAILLGKLFGFNKGITAGMLGGAMTQSSVLGTAEGAIAHLPGFSAAEKVSLESNVAIAYAITYIFGTAGMVMFCKIVPKLMKLNLKEEARKLEREMSGGAGDDIERSPELFSWHKRLNLRAYKVANPNVIGKKISQVERLFPGKVAIEKLKRGGKVIDAGAKMVLHDGDEITIVGHRRNLLSATEIIGPEISDKAVTDLIGEIMRICVLNKEVAGKTLAQLSDKYGREVFLRRLTRVGQELPLARKTVIHKYDILEVAGSRKDIENFAKYLGYPERPTAVTDLIMVGLGCVLGTLIGLLAVKVGGIPITLGVGGGVLISGLLFGYFRAVHPTFGQIPDGAQWILTDLGLNLFVACVGLIAGPTALHALKTTGGSLVFAGVILTLTPVTAGLIFGRLVFRKLNPLLLFGALTGSETCTAALNGLKEDSDSAMPAIGYTVCYAFGNVILTIWGTVLVSVM